MKPKSANPAASKEMLERIREWSSVTGRKLLFYHNDPDGISSAALWMKAFPGFEPVAREGPIMNAGFVRWVSDQDPDVLVFLDLPVDQEWKKIQWLEKHNPDLKMIIIDHHIPERNLSSGRLAHVNNKFVLGLKGKYLPAAYLVYRVLEGCGTRLENHKWVAGAGIIGDYGQKDCAEFFKGMKSGMAAMGRASDLMSAAVTLKGRKGADRVLKILLRIGGRDSGMQEFLERSTLKLWKRFVDAEIKNTMKEFKTEKEWFPEANMVAFRIKSKFNIVSVISTMLSEKSPGKVIVIYKLSAGGLWKASGRLQNGRLDLGTIFKRAVKGIGTGGGHRQAAGARVKSWERFKQRLLEELNQARKTKTGKAKPRQAKKAGKARPKRNG